MKLSDQIADLRSWSKFVDLSSRKGFDDLVVSLIKQAEALEALLPSDVPKTTAERLSDCLEELLRWTSESCRTYPMVQMARRLTTELINEQNDNARKV